MTPSNDIRAVGSLADPVRRRLYDHVAQSHNAVSREAAAEAAGVPVSKAKFHLERLVGEGLLETEYRRINGRSGPGAGRPAKLYRRAGTEFHVSLPERRYDLMGDILATAIERTASGHDLTTAVSDAAHAAGAHSARSIQASSAAAHSSPIDAHSSPIEESAAHSLDRLSHTLTRIGYEPETVNNVVRLRNCPFDLLSKEHTQLVCGVNRDYVQGMLDELGCEGVCACLEPSEGYCCVTARPEQPHEPTK
ncbi:MAG: helix-turn-helix transcriptional regulator [Leucobacter sp.]